MLDHKCRIARTVIVTAVTGIDDNGKTSFPPSSFRQIRRASPLKRI
ncbi:hypothetical protein PO124_18635 [Bacillus licheniformis]|nr:hypothetical protein [Bacillus licheniformis]